MKRAKAKLFGVVSSLLPRSQYLYRMIWFGCIAVSIPIVLAASVYYQYSMNTLMERFREDSRASVALLKDRMESAFLDVEYESLQLAVNPTLRDGLSQRELANDYARQQRILDFLLVHKNSNDLIEEIVYYAAASNRVLTNAYGSAALERFPQRETVLEALSLEDPAGWLYLSTESRDVLSFVRKLPIMSVNEPEGVLIVHVKRPELTRLLASHFITLQDQTLAVLNADNEALLHSSDVSLLGRSVEKQAGFRRVLEEGAASGTLMAEDRKGERLLTAYQKSSFGRNYVSFLPEREMKRQLEWIRAFVVFSLIFTLAGGILLTVVTSRMAFTPIDKLIRYGKDLRTGFGEGKGKGNEIEIIRSSLEYLNEQTEQLHNYVRKTKPDLRERFLLKLLRGELGRREAIADSCRLFDVTLEQRTIVMVVKVENLYKEKRFLPNEGAIIVFAVKNVLLELLGSKRDVQGFVVEKDDRETVALLQASGEAAAAELPDAAKRYAEESCAALKNYLSFSVSVGIGGAKEDLSGAAESYREAAHALQYRLFHDTDAILVYEEVSGTKRHSAFNYPKALAEDLLSSLSEGDYEGAAHALQQFYERVRASESLGATLQSYQVLLSSIIQSLEEKGPGVMDLIGENLFEQLKARQTYREVHDWFVEVLFPLHRKITEEIRKNSSKTAVHLVCTRIKSDPGAPHTLTECAERVGMSPSYLSRLFKQEVGMPFIEYVMIYKVEEAKRLLSETDKSVTDIAEAVGYSERNLNRAFQRYVGQSPKQYRLSIR